MPVEVILPKVDMDMATGQIARWYVAEGAKIKKGDTLFEIETDKAAMEIEAPASGIIRDITGKERIDIPVGQPVAWIYEEGEAVGGAPTPAPAEQSNVAGRSPETPRDAEHSAASTASPATLAVKAPDSTGGHDAVRATPLARRLARDAGINLADVTGSGPHGRVVKTDVEALVAARSETRTASNRTDEPPAVEDSVAVVADPVLRLFADDSYTLIPHDTMRRTIARRLVEAKSTIPHFYLSLDCEIDALLAIRSELNGSAPLKDGIPGFKLSVNDLVIKALAYSLRQLPEANVSWTEGGMLRHRHVDVGVAVSIPGGLITPIIRQADQKSLSVISNEMRDLAARARLRKLRPEEYQGGTTSVSNLGMYGVREFSAVINPPHASILAVGAGEQRAVIKAGSVVAATVMSVSLSADHRAIDGALAAELLAAFKEAVEKPLRLVA